VDLVSIWNPQNSHARSWIAAEAAFGNGYLNLAERRRQGKINGMRQFTAGHHEFTLFGVGYYGSSRIPAHDHCLEVIVVRGKAAEIEELPIL
jgi:hypothetical protein